MYNDTGAILNWKKIYRSLFFLNVYDKMRVIIRMVVLKNYHSSLKPFWERVKDHFFCFLTWIKSPQHHLKLVFLTTQVCWHVCLFNFRCSWEFKIFLCWYESIRFKSNFYRSPKKMLRKGQYHFKESSTTLDFKTYPLLVLSWY